VTARTKARKRALDVLFEADQRALGVGDVLEARLAEPGGQTPLPAYSSQIIRGVLERWHTIDSAIAEAAEGWTMDRMPAVDRAILRIATWEILHNPEVGTAVAIDEAVSLAETLSTDHSAGFINGVLGTIAKADHRDEASTSLIPDAPGGEAPPSTEGDRVE
jgi:N utilization substance protein B